MTHAMDFAASLEGAIARGGDTDTNGCIVGALLGARFGVSAIPQHWIAAVKNSTSAMQLRKSNPLRRLSSCLLRDRSRRKASDAETLVGDLMSLSPPLHDGE